MDVLLFVSMEWWGKEIEWLKSVSSAMAWSIETGALARQKEGETIPSLEEDPLVVSMSDDDLLSDDEFGIGAFGKLFMIDPSLKQNEKVPSILEISLNVSESSPQNLSDEISNKEDAFEKMTEISNRGILEEFERKTGSKLGKYEWKFMNEFCKTMDDFTLPQRVKELLILRTITDHELNEQFGVRKLHQIILKESNEGDHLIPVGDGQYVIELDFSKNDPEYVLVVQNIANSISIINGDQVELSTKSSFWNEAMHRIYHYVIADQLRHSPASYSPRSQVLRDAEMSLIRYYTLPVRTGGIINLYHYKNVKTDQIIKCYFDSTGFVCFGA